MTQRRPGAIGRTVALSPVAGEVSTWPLDWLQTAISIDRVTTSGGDDAVRFSPSADVRLTSNIKLGFGIDHVHTPVESRTYSFELQVKTN